MAATRGPQRSGFRAGVGGEMLSEFLGTFVLIMFGLGVVAVAVVGLPGSGRQSVPFGADNWVLIAFGWGMAVTLGVYVAGGVSSAHINPAVTLAFAVRRGFPWAKVLPYWIAQMAGAFVAAALIYAVYAPAIRAYDVANNIASRSASKDTFAIFATFPAKYFGTSPWGPLLDQIVGTALLVGIIAAIIDNRNTAPGANLGGYIIGLVVVGIGMSFGVNAGYAINPARDLGPRLWTAIEGWNPLAFPGPDGAAYWWVPIVGPLVGGVIGILVYDLFIGGTLAGREPEAAGAAGVPEQRQDEPAPGRTADEAGADRTAHPPAHEPGRTGDGTSPTVSERSSGSG